MDLVVDPDRVGCGRGPQPVVRCGEPEVGVVEPQDDLLVSLKQPGQPGGQRPGVIGNRCCCERGCCCRCVWGAHRVGSGQPFCSVCQSASSAAARISSAICLACVERRSMNAAVDGSGLSRSTICTRTSNSELPSTMILAGESAASISQK